MLVIALVLTRLPMARTALHGSEFINDEPDLTLMALDRFFGVPLMNTHWPAITNQLLMVPSIAADFIKSGEPRTVEGFVEYAGRMYRDERPLVFVHRWTVIGLTTFATAVFAWTFRRHGLVAMLAAFLLLQQAHLIIYGTLGLGNGPALAAMLLLFAACLTRRFFLAGLMLGVAVASRNTSVLVLPIVVGLIWQRPIRSNMRPLALGVGGTVLGGALAWAPALLDPIRWAKGNLGNFVKIGDPAGPLAAARVLFDSGGTWFPFAGLWWVATLAAVGWLFVTRKHLGLAIGFLIAVGSTIVISGGSPLVETRYFDAILLGSVLVILTALVERSVRTAVGGRVGIIGACAVFAALGIGQAQMQFASSIQGLRPVERAVAASIPAADGVTIIDRSLLSFIRSRATSASLRQVADDTERAVRDGTALREFVERYRLPPAVAEAFGSQLSEKEQMDIVRKRVAATVEPRVSPIEILPCGDTNSARRYGCMSVADGVMAVREGRAAEAILTVQSLETVDIEGLTVETVWFDRYVRIRRP